MPTFNKHNGKGDTTNSTENAYVLPPEPHKEPGIRKQVDNQEHIQISDMDGLSTKEAAQKQLPDANWGAQNNAGAHEEIQRPETAVRKRSWTRSVLYASTGVGFFAEGYYLFAIGNVASVFRKEYPLCWARTHPLCRTNLIESTTYSQVVGLIAGMLLFGLLLHAVGTRIAGLTTAIFMLIGGVLITAADGPNQRGLFAMYTVAQAVLGFGVGGEYPIASGLAIEHSADAPGRRGCRALLTFSMQGLGNVFNVVFLLIILASTHQNGPFDFNNKKLELVWRLSFGLGLIPIVLLLIWRSVLLRRHTVAKSEVKTNTALPMGGIHASPSRKLVVFFYYYSARLVGVSVCWFLWEFTLYGHRLFQGFFIEILYGPNVGLVKLLEYTLLNSTVALAGYYLAALLVDQKWLGRFRLQCLGFGFTLAIYFACAARFNDLLGPDAIHAFQFLYFFGSFWGQFGPNATTWLIPGEIFPTETRPLAQGFAAAVGKAGALVAGLIFQHTSDRDKFYYCAIFCACGLLVTVLLVPDHTGLSLRHLDNLWACQLDGSSSAYEETTGAAEALDKQHISCLERLFKYEKSRLFKSRAHNCNDP